MWFKKTRFELKSIDAEFIVNVEKRTVVVLIKSVRTGQVRARGIAKCMPDEVFNADIGKAIALCKALKLSIPDEFMYAVQPDEVVEGMVVKTYDYDGKHHATSDVDKVDVLGGIIRLSKENRGLNGRAKYTSFKEELGDKIINDTNAKY